MSYLCLGGYYETLHSVVGEGEDRAIILYHCDGGVHYTAERIGTPIGSSGTGTLCVRGIETLLFPEKRFQEESVPRCREGLLETQTDSILFDGGHVSYDRLAHLIHGTRVIHKIVHQALIEKLLDCDWSRISLAYPHVRESSKFAQEANKTAIVSNT